MSLQERLSQWTINGQGGHNILSKGSTTSMHAVFRVLPSQLYHGINIFVFFFFCCVAVNGPERIVIL